MITACGQMEATTLEQAGEVWPVVDRLAEQAAAARADVLVLPECTYPAYWLESVERYLRDDIERSATVLERFAAVAAKHRFWLVAGFVEEADGRPYNSAAVFDRTGRLIGVARKNFMWDCDNRWFSPGRSMSVFDSEFGRMGVLICADARSPEIVASLAAQGAEFVLEPTAWVNASPLPRIFRNVQADFMIRARTVEFGVPFACASKAGREGDKLEYVGQSQIVDAAGRLLAGAPIGGECLIHADVIPRTARQSVMDDATYERLTRRALPVRPRSAGDRCTLRMTDDADAICAAIEAAGGRVARLTTADLASYAPSRVAALDAAQALVFQGRVTDEVMVRTRAAENRVFAIVASSEVQIVVAPDGSVAWKTGGSDDAPALDLSRADDKRFTPETDLWEQRRVECYHLARQAAVTCRA